MRRQSKANHRRRRTAKNAVTIRVKSFLRDVSDGEAHAPGKGARKGERGGQVDAENQTSTIEKDECAKSTRGAARCVAQRDAMRLMADAARVVAADAIRRGEHLGAVAAFEKAEIRQLPG